MFMSIALAALAAAQAAAPQTGSSPQWVPLKKSPSAQLQQEAPAQPVTAGTATARSAETLTNQTVISLVQAGLGPETIVAKIGASAGSYDTSTNALITLKQAGVPDSVIAAMLNRSKSPVLANAVADNSNPDPLAPHAPGIYVLDQRGAGRMTRIDATMSNQLKTSNLWGYALTSGISSLKM